MVGAPQPLDATALLRVLEHEAAGIAVFKAAPEPEDFVVEYANPSFRSMCGAAALVGRRFSDVWPLAADLLTPGMKRALSSGRPMTVEDTLIDVEGEPEGCRTGYVTFAVSRVLLDGDHSVLVEVQDVTARHEAETQAQRELETTRLLLGAARVLNERVELEHVLRKLAEVLLSSTAHQRSFVFLWDEESRILSQAASAGKNAFQRGKTFRFEDVSRVTKGVIRDRKTAVVDFDALPPQHRGKGLSKEGSHILVVAPVVWQDSLVGLIGVDDPGERREFSDREIAIVEAIAAQAASAIENASLFKELSETLRQLARKDRDIRQAYSDVIDAVTGGRLILVSSDELADVLAGDAGPEHELRDPDGLRDARHQAAAELTDVPCAKDLVLAFSEAATNMVKHATGGTYQVYKMPGRVQVVLRDHGQGIDFHDLPKATLVSGYSTKQTLGLGFTMMMELTDRLLLCTGTTGTTVVLECDLAS